MSCRAIWKKVCAAKLRLVPPLFLLLISLQSSAQTVSNKPPEDLSNWLTLLMAAEGGGGWSTTSGFSPTAYGGVKLGVPVKLTPGYP